MATAVHTYPGQMLPMYPTQYYPPVYVPMVVHSPKSAAEEQRRTYVDALRKNIKECKEIEVLLDTSRYQLDHVYLSEEERRHHGSRIKELKRKIAKAQPILEATVGKLGRSNGSDMKSSLKAVVSKGSVESVEWATSLFNGTLKDASESQIALCRHEAQKLADYLKKPFQWAQEVKAASSARPPTTTATTVKTATGHHGSSMGGSVMLNVLYAYPTPTVAIPTSHVPKQSEYIPAKVAPSAPTAVERWVQSVAQSTQPPPPDAPRRPHHPPPVVNRASKTQSSISIQGNGERNVLGLSNLR